MFSGFIYRDRHKIQRGKGLDSRIRDGHLLAIIDRLDYWQLSYVILKGSYQKLRADGIETLQRAIVDLAPEFRDRVHHLKDWSKIKFRNKLLPVF
ncbi:MAG TPA: hypothetical protein VK211_18390 [Kamptonema sp.]|nr:hypothetical protein [Kamptonema sp.]